LKSCAGIFLILLAVFYVACGGSPTSNTKTEEPAKPAAPPVPPEVQGAAEAALGSEAEVLAFGDLSLGGKQEALVINRLKKTANTKVPGTLVTRAAVIENDGGAWKQVFLCDEHLKNPSGFLASTPLAPVPGWRLQWEQHADQGLVMYFTPIEKPAGGYLQTIGVRFNTKVKRYQSLDRNYENFLGESPSLEMPTQRM